jgi:histidinol dehydrogenase
MHCAVNGAVPPARDVIAWSELAAELAATGNVRLVQIYGKARPSPHDPVCTPLPLDSLEERSLVLRAAFEAAGVAGTPIAVYE